MAYEGDGESRSLPFFLTLTAPATSPVSVEYSTADATAVAGLDYEAVRGTATFAVGQAVVRVDIPIIADLAAEPDEDFSLSLGTPTGASIAFGEGKGSILDDDPYRTSIQFSGDRGDYVSLGRRFTATPLDGVMTVTRNSANGVHIAFRGATTWSLDFSDPQQMTLGPGFYLDAARFPTVVSGAPGLAVSEEYRTCDTLTGRFIVLEAEYDGTGKVVRFAADFEQHCFGVAPALFGSVRYNSAVPVGPPPTAGAGFHTVTPCRLLDTREIEAPVYGAGADATRSFSATGHCGIPLTARAVALNVTAVGSTQDGDLRFFAAATLPPVASVVNYARGQVRASNAIIPLGTTGAVQMVCDMNGGAVDVVADVVGYFE